jgi:DNA-binding NarL/FixJ family response regulator
MAKNTSSEERWRGLRAQGAYLDAAANAVLGERHLKQVRDWPSVAKPLGLVWVITSYPLVAAGLEKTLEGKADVRIGGDSVGDGSPSCVVLYADGPNDDFGDRMRRVHELYPGVPLLVFGPRLDLALAWAALKNGADGFVHAAMDREQMVRAVEVVQKGELAAPRQLIPYLLSQNETPEVGDLSTRQREVLELVVEGLSNAEIAGRLYLTESTIKQHLRAAYKLLGVRNRTEAAKMIKNHAHEF